MFVGSFWTEYCTFGTPLKVLFLRDDFNATTIYNRTIYIRNDIEQYITPRYETFYRKILKQSKQK